FSLDQSLETLENALERKAEALRIRIESIGITKIGTIEVQLIDHALLRTERAFDILSRQVEDRFSAAGQSVNAGYAALEALSPLGILKRGYAALTDADGTLIRSTDQLSPGDLIRARLTDGNARLSVEDTGPLP
ncbi:MAG: hypothetical protein LBN36_01290, partial [Clostridiales Family XIII bacterium]|nr:hypothetical protein [Clostridiales Family XIII bacterium]